MKTSVPVSIPGDDDRPLTPMDVDEEGTDDDEREIQNGRTRFRK
jgi:hypothetical protein